MSKPIHQHFIPKSYLNNFAVNDNNKNFISAKNSDNNKIITVSTRDICVGKNLYTLPSDDNKFAIEHFYADHIDSKFPELYKILTDSKIIEIDSKTKTDIIATVLSLYFRTPKFLNQENKIFEEIVRTAHKHSKGGDFIVEYGDDNIIITSNEVEQIIREYKENNRIKFLGQHLDQYERLIKSKIQNVINVYHITDESQLITSDNPVLIRPFVDPTAEDFDEDKFHKQTINPFDESNTIHLPLNDKTMLTILPNLDSFPDFKIRRLEKKKIDTIIYNNDIERYAERWILGKPSSIENHITDQSEFNTHNPVALEAMGSYKEKVIQFKELFDIIKQNGVTSNIVMQKVEFMEKLESVKNDPNIEKVIRTIKAANK
ncbi:DUF4238 domain-containing protein [Chryseobacterium sp. NKUCC03_KSP]|uniref:DUF4238 domain-containing protein n=1 Tax=Chryseobacterium sp. NKUCC03_KSP TaxID=2842125 RepID=UPI001C5B55BB|nr:DUF4238 domain-containing protein [Chryseobacterium sp. NKUCC03_KSP]MBW3522889.1 DUF4238 domain-containing protein [Chryseobacterium sp. NKUCC03_KSP]